ncbi:hypothetical protein CASFOL_033940 [Castilleja foliolosa]|uniref:Uncharacterized protein n=1 Tax=Castilleja foliolosa TaxID=1961234 RepID=A0ABD3BZ05_9LAMI
MAAIAMLDLLRRNPNFGCQTFSSKSIFSSKLIGASTAASFAITTPFAFGSLFGNGAPRISYCDAGAAALDEDYVSSIRTASRNIFQHDGLNYTTKQYDIQLKPLFSAFYWRAFALTSVRSFLLFYLPLLEPRPPTDDFDDEERPLDLVDPFKKSVKQIIREVFKVCEILLGEAWKFEFQNICVLRLRIQIPNFESYNKHSLVVVTCEPYLLFQKIVRLTSVVTTRRVFERLAVHYVSQRMAWKLLKDVPRSAARKAARGMPVTIYFIRVGKTTFRGHFLGVLASWVVQVGIDIYRFFSSMSKPQDDNDAFYTDADNATDRAEQAKILAKRVYGTTFRCGASIIFASIGAGIGALLIRPSTGQWIGCTIGDLAGPFMLAFCFEKFHFDL